MRIRISHATTYRYEQPPSSVIQMLRLTPRNHDGQYVVDWRIELSAGCPLRQQEDAFGNIIQTFTADGPFDTLTVTVDGEVETQDTHGIIAGALERFPPSFYLRETDLTTADAAIVELAERTKAGEKPGDNLSVLHALMRNLNTEITFDPAPTQVTTTAAEAFALRRGVCQDLTHIFIAASRHLGIPARYIGGHFHRGDGVTDQDAGHAWAEVHIEPLGWVAFDPTNGISATESHVRVAAGLDYLGAAPVRGTRFGGGAETLKVTVQVDQALRQSQS